MGVAALVLGIISIVLGFIPFCGIIALLPAIIGLILGIIDLAKRKKAAEKFGKSLAGIICSGLAIVVILFWWITAGALFIEGFQDGMQDAMDDIEYSYDYKF